MTVCLFCGTHFEPKPPHWNRVKYCSDECRSSRKRDPVQFEVNAETVRELFDYNPDSGIFLWKPRKLRPEHTRIDKAWNTRLAGRPAGRPHRHGHLYANINYRNYALHRLAWLYVYGKWPSRSIDHINGNPTDNRMSNLRECTQTQNMRNARIRKDNTSGIKGVYWVKKEQKWRAFINVGGKLIILGTFEMKEEAAECRRKAASKEFGDFARE